MENRMKNRMKKNEKKVHRGEREERGIRGLERK